MDLRLLIFNYWIEAARDQLTRAALYSAPVVRADFLKMTQSFVRLALRAANAMGCADRKALCLRIMNWLRADLIRCNPIALAA
ncbi:hypothetical protein [Bosea sp. PAMC 26642]|uniref:hypothetical protein n=1 Tax=Bosea sp. (strain PAMC 26642) TaxID=1792307 RepID=UPI00077011EC|nr:hypothetical protein [Bosea sp. PAMC 26642]AMJ59362.1 hypothetical protein AXW83_02735 [Bosea sp. PAMC 26642]